MKRVLFVINSLKVGGAERLVVDLVNNWTRTDELHLMLLENDATLSAQITRGGCTIGVCASRSVLGKVLELRSYLKKSNVDVVFSHLERSNKVSILATLGLSARLFSVVHSVNLYPSGSMPMRVARLLYRLGDCRVVAISEAVEKYVTGCLGLGKSKVVRIDNGVDLSRVKQVRQFTNGPLSFYTLGRLVSAKGYDVLLNYLGDERLESVPWRLSIIGDGAQRQELKDIASNKGIDDKVLFLGEADEPFDKVPQNAICIAPSRREGLPISVLEGLSHGIPVLTSGIEQFDFIVEGMHGYKFSLDNCDEFVERFMRFQQMSEKALNVMSHNAVMLASEYGIDRCVDKYEMLYGD